MSWNEGQIHLALLENLLNELRCDDDRIQRPQAFRYFLYLPLALLWPFRFLDDVCYDLECD